MKDLNTGRKVQKLMISLFFLSAKAILPRSIQGIDNENVFKVKMLSILQRLQNSRNNQVEDIVVVGGGFIGVEVAENLN